MAQTQTSNQRTDNQATAGAKRDAEPVTNQKSTFAVEDPSQITNGEDAEPESERIAMRAYECWHERGCPEGSPEVDWHRAENELRSAKRGADRSRGANA